MIGFYSYTVILTYIGLASAIFGMMQALNGQILTAVICLMVSGVCDMFDGKVARTKKNRTDGEKRFGIQIDSLCDLVCFGVFPAVIGYAIGIRSFFGMIYLVVYVLAAVIRLAYFNVMEEQRQNETDECRKYYQGLPVTTVAIIIPVVFLSQGFFRGKFILIYEIVMVVVAFLFILDFRVKKADKKGMIGIALFGLLIFIRLLFSGVR
ncbi:MAG: CDP-alcohol phosphatidyltransferase family protein [Clostridiales bacterium]|nr:CDP-alcohol phosphatidyltransferase family protein [Clostridiales bacterium]MDY3745212.1 CDP-alcohol phosphatidyltransferase family protein [Lachnospiraceae bacterium]